jgi:hypothetical protein
VHALLRLGGTARCVGEAAAAAASEAPAAPRPPADPRPGAPRQPAGGGAAYECYAASPERPCSPYADCTAWDDGQCGFEHSSYQQAAFCAVREPPTWPALLQVPLAQYRNAQLRDDGALREGGGGGGGGGGGAANATLAPQPPLLLPYTGRDEQAAGRLMVQLLARDASLSAGLLATFLRSPLLAGGRQQAGLASLDLCAPNATRAALQQLLASATGNGTAGSGGSSSGAADLGRASQQLSALLSELGAVLGTAAPTSPTSYLEPAFIEGSAAFDTQSGAGGGGGLAGGSLLGGGGSQARAARETAGEEVGRRAACLASRRWGPVPAAWRPRVAKRHSSQRPAQVRPLYYVAPDCSALAPADARVVAQLGCALDKLLGVPLRCASAQPQWAPDQQRLSREIFCGWQAAGCVALDGQQAGEVREVRLPAYQVGRRELPGPHGSAACTHAAPSSNRPGQRSVVLDPHAQVDAAIRQWPSMLFDWRGTGNESFDVAISANHTFTSPATNLAPQLQRWAAPLNLATNAYLREQLVGQGGWRFLQGCCGRPADKTGRQ